MTDESEFEPYIREREVSLCPCKSKQTYKDCCMPFHYRRARPETAEQLMRSRYSAFFFRRVEYIVETTHPNTRSPTLQAELEASINDLNWHFLTILNTSKGGAEDRTGKVEFVAAYFSEGEAGELKERSRFKKHKGMWKYLDGKG